MPTVWWCYGRAIQWSIELCRHWGRKVSAASSGSCWSPCECHGSLDRWCNQRVDPTMPAPLPHQSRRDGSTSKAVYAPWNNGSCSPASGLSQSVRSGNGVIFDERHGGSQLLPRVQHTSFHLRFDDTALPAFHWTTRACAEISRAHGKSGRIWVKLLEAPQTWKALLLKVYWHLTLVSSFEFQSWRIPWSANEIFQNCKYRFPCPKGFRVFQEPCARFLVEQTRSCRTEGSLVKIFCL